MRVLRWIVCCVFEGLLEDIVRHDDHGDTFLSGYPGYPAGKTRRVLGRTRTRRRVVPVRVNPPGTRIVNERVAPYCAAACQGCTN